MKHFDYKSDGLYFKVAVNTLGNQRRTICERKYKEFEYLRTALARAFPGCFVPKMTSTDLGSVASALGLSSDLPQGYLERRKTMVNVRNVEAFCERLTFY